MLRHLLDLDPGSGGDAAAAEAAHPGRVDQALPGQGRGQGGQVSAAQDGG